MDAAGPVGARRAAIVSNMSLLSTNIASHPEPTVRFDRLGHEWVERGERAWELPEPSWGRQDSEGASGSSSP